ncbi:MAG: PASTA domain-containing protein [Candidatus Eisenbacteria bacterium]|uniref:PASTA domain-containing protein n=1 Tax=Eiseniibacteriota bacterium TaxID=2212470 RepID=A0A849SHI8_UNCEI|nr:PASTA domain-containing protein [Candidatus Eisenbacteria bacterium]
MAHTESRRSRVLMVAAGLCLGFAVLWGRLVWLQLCLHGHYAQRAEELQEQRVPLRAVRGRLLDRHGRVMARDLVTYSIAAAPREMRDPQVTARALARLLEQEPRRLQREFTRKPRYLWVARHVAPEIAEGVRRLKERGLYLTPETQRVYPLEAAAGEILGRTNLDNSGVEGLELQYDEELRGRSGWVTRFRDGRGRSHELPRGMRRDPVDGNHVMLTLDSDLQAIVESRLAAAVDSLRAVRGFALFVDPRTGEILACANAPHLPAGRGRNWSFTDVYEPGSTFKVFTAAAALEEGLVRPGQIIEASPNGEAKLVQGAVFHDVHKQPRYSFFDAVRWSSNIVLGRVGLMLGDERLYRYVSALGFGSITGITFPGEAGGRLRTPDHWSLRSAPTVAIGHELSVTPLQLVMGYAAIANGGVLMRPRLVREVRGPGGAVVWRETPEAAQRVFSEHTTDQVRDMMAAVVDSGTARAAQVPGLRVAGKTGTAQKYDASVGGYGKGMYLSSFAGFAPADAPTLVGVVVIDEPRGRHYYGGEVAAPVFRQVLLDWRGLPSAPMQSGTALVAARPPAPAPVTVPDLRLLPRRVAESRLADYGLRAAFQGAGPRVLGQEPAAGVATERGSRVTVWLAASDDSLGRTLPDLVGRPIREALRELTRRQVAVRLVGHGNVVRQEPPAGASLPIERPCVLYCAPGAPSRRDAADAEAKRPDATLSGQLGGRTTRSVVLARAAAARGHGIGTAR